jgi:hypothetical protein
MDLKERVKSLGFRVTKDVKGKRVKLTKKELQSKLGKNHPTLENQARDAKKFIKVCKMVLKEAEPNTPRTPRPVRTTIPPPPPMRVIPVPPPPPANNPRARLMANLQANLKRRGLAA